MLMEDIVEFLAVMVKLLTVSALRKRDWKEKRLLFVDMGDDTQEQKAIDDLQDVEWMGRAIGYKSKT